MTTIDTLLDDAGRTFADEAGIALKDEPAPLYRLLVLSVLLSGRVQAKLGTRACRELVDSGLGTPQKVRDAPRDEVLDALTRAKFLAKEQTTGALQDGAALVADRWHGDLRRMRSEADGDAARLAELLTEVPRLGPVGADIFTREVQAVWPEFRPHLDVRALDGAEVLGLPRDAGKLAEQVSGDDVARLAAALVRSGIQAQPTAPCGSTPM
ncbi:endonuclease [Actinomycetospora sp. NBRC 106375]|uniref:endonuclease n=1 Tax=Actinomycetospora sp. NBRC 106375 TaxID=3032207 RepID=UPI0024A3E492|nr:endonuclease [Actinomycetospora sp. NBRC 106375]GLZ46533.1 endonuclease [Actinomycetospora sp. NBRC 106375]